MINRRSFLVGLIAASVIIRSGILMPIKVIEPVRVFTLADYEVLMNKYIEDFQQRITDAIMFGNSNFNYDGLKFYMEKDQIKATTVNIFRVEK